MGWIMQKAAARMALEFLGNRYARCMNRMALVTLDAWTDGITDDKLY